MKETLPVNLQHSTTNAPPSHPPASFTCLQGHQLLHLPTIPYPPAINSIPQSAPPSHTWLQGHQLLHLELRTKLGELPVTLERKALPLLHMQQRPPMHRDLAVGDERLEPYVSHEPALEAALLAKALLGRLAARPERSSKVLAPAGAVDLHLWRVRSGRRRCMEVSGQGGMERELMITHPNQQPYIKA